MKHRLLALTAATAALLTVAVSADAATRTVFLGAGGSPQAKPRLVALSADGTLEVEKTSWSSWGGSVAVGDGTAYYHGCTPSCAADRGHQAAVVVRLSDPVVCRRTRDFPAGRYYDHVSVDLRRNGRPLDRAFLVHQHWAPCRVD